MSFFSEDDELARAQVLRDEALDRKRHADEVARRSQQEAVLLLPKILKRIRVAYREGKQCMHIHFNLRTNGHSAAQINAILAEEATKHIGAHGRVYVCSDGDTCPIGHSVTLFVGFS